MKLSSKISAAVVVAAAPWLVAPAAAGPLSQSAGLRAAVPSSIENVQYRRYWRGGRYRDGGLIGAGLGLGLGIAADVGGAIAGITQPFDYYGYAPFYDQGYYGYNYGYAPAYGWGVSPGYSYGYAPGYAQTYGAAGDDVAYCEQRFKSYDPRSGTYLGYDGVRHACP